MGSDARGVTTIKKKIKVVKDCLKWVKQTFLQHLLLGADDLVVIGNQIPFSYSLRYLTIPGLNMGLRELTSNFFNLVLPSNKYHDPSEITWSSLR